MAKKSRTPPPPRKVQAPRQRTAERDPDERKRLFLLAFAGAGLLALAAVIIGILVSRGGGANDGGVPAIMRAAGCTYKVYPATSQNHVALTAKVKYNSDPPSNGPHYGQPALFGNYSDPVPQIQAVHNLEHGGMLIEYGSGVQSATVDRTTAFYDESPDGLLVFPYLRLKTKIALVAWTADEGRLSSNRTSGYHGEGRVALCGGFNEKAFETFRDRFRAKGPERFPLDALQPGQ